MTDLGAHYTDGGVFSRHVRTSSTPSGNRLGSRAIINHNMHTRSREAFFNWIPPMESVIYLMSYSILHYMSTHFALSRESLLRPYYSHLIRQIGRAHV